MKIKDRINNFLSKTPKVETSRNIQSNNINFSDVSELFTSTEEISEAIFSIVGRLSNTLASLPIKMIDNEHKQPTDCSAFNLISVGPRHLTTFDFFRDIETFRNLYGNAYVQIFRDNNGTIYDLKLLKHGQCAPVRTVGDNELYYQVSAPNGQIRYVHYMEILHFKFVKVSGDKGANPVEILGGTLNYDNEVRKISIKQLNGNNEGLKVKFDSNMAEETKAAVVKNIADFYQDNGGLLVEENGVSIDRIQRELVDSKLLDTDKISRSRIAMVFNVPEHFVRSGETSYNSQEQLNLEFLNYNLVPTLTQFEQELNKKTLSDSEREKGYRYKFNASALLRADTQTRGNFYQLMRRGGAYSANDVRRFEDLPPEDIPGMDDYHISGDLYPINMDPTLRKTTNKGVTKKG